MSVIRVAGSSLQAAHDAAQPGDTLAAAAGTYAGLRISKPLTIEGSGSLVIEGPGNAVEWTPEAAGSVLRGATVRGSTGAHSANLLVRAPDVTLEDLSVTDSACYGIRQTWPTG